MFLCLREAGFDRAERIEQRAKSALVHEIVGTASLEGRESRLAALLNVLARAGKLGEGTRLLREKCLLCVEAGGVSETLMELKDRAVVLLESVVLAEDMLSVLGGPSSRDDEELLQPVVDAIDLQMSRKLRSRLDEILRLRLDMFVEAYHSLNEFESRWLKGGRELKIVLNSLARQYLEQFHRNQCVNLTAVLDGERWVGVAVPSEFQQIVNRLIRLPLQPALAHPAEELCVGNESFHPVAAALMCVQGISQYMQCAESLPSAAAESISLLCKMVKLFNSKSALLILGTEATKGPAQLKVLPLSSLSCPFFF